MAQKTVKKKFNLNIDEDKDVFLSSLNKKIRNARKKIGEIEELEKKGRDNLKKEQLDKINTRGEVMEVIRYNESIKDLYYSALKAAQDEGKAAPTQQETQAARKPTAEEDKTEQAAPARVEEPQQQVSAGPTEEERQADNARIIRETLSKVLNLVHFAQLFRDQSSVQGFRQAFDSQRGQFGIDSVPDFESFHEFFVKVFTFSESDRFGKVGDKINGSLAELESYINGADQPALRNKSYRHLQSVVESVAQAPFFLNHNAEVEVPKARVAAEPSAIGSELKRGHETQEAPAPVVQQEKTRSPEKETKAPEPEPVGRDWGSVEDDEEEEQVQEEVQQEKTFEGEGGRTEEPERTATKEEKKQEDDGFISVKDKRKEKKEETGYRGSGTRPYRGEGRGGRGGYRGGRREGEEGQEGGYRRPRRDDQQEGAGEGAGEGQQRGERGGYRGRGEGRGGRGGYRGEGRGGRGGYSGGYRGARREEGQGERPTGTAEGTRTTQ